MLAATGCVNASGAPSEPTAAPSTSAARPVAVARVCDKPASGPANCT